MVSVMELGGAVDIESSGSGEVGAVVRRTRTRRGWWKLGDGKEGGSGHYLLAEGGGGEMRGVG